MEATNWDTYKFRCHTLPILMKGSKTEILGDTAKSLLKKIWEKERWGNDDFGSVNKQTKKGIEVESDAIQLCQEVFSKTLFKNIEEYENDFIAGIPDLVKDLSDIKASWDTSTFLGNSEKKIRESYFWQQAGYMWLTGETKSNVLLCLVTTPVELVESEMYKKSYELTEQQIDIERRKHDAGYYPKKQRVRKFVFTAGEKEFDKIMTHVTAAREYLKAFDLEMGWEPFDYSHINE